MVATCSKGNTVQVRKHGRVYSLRGLCWEPSSVMLLGARFSQCTIMQGFILAETRVYYTRKLLVPVLRRIGGNFFMILYS